ncbi:MAG: electron transfer flavoprotein subunit alpha/FixB family protein [Desulfobacterales bacterium]|nr:MAG: electron transfer flavoprotein subunit alpha/FixB family protein [Desulfobacterales bacterium]
MSSMQTDIWIWVHHREGTVEEVTFGLIAEAQRLLADIGEEGTVTAVALGADLEDELPQLGTFGVSRVLYLEDEYLGFYHGELFARTLAELAARFPPNFILMAHTPEASDLCARLGALLEAALVTRAMDLKIDDQKNPVVIRPVANGYLFQDVCFNSSPCIVTFLPAVLNFPEPEESKSIKILKESLRIPPEELQTKVIRRIEADPASLDLEEADIVVAGGRGVGKGDTFGIIHELAAAVGGSVAGTRPVIDWLILPYERQIGQTGKSITPRLIINCGISGANEYTAGMEKSRKVIAINTDPRARIFRFSDLGIVGDVHEVVPLLIAPLKEI